MLITCISISRSLRSSNQLQVVVTAWTRSHIMFHPCNMAYYSYMHRSFSRRLLENQSSPIIPFPIHTMGAGCENTTKHNSPNILDYQYYKKCYFRVILSMNNVKILKSNLKERVLLRKCTTTLRGTHANLLGSTIDILTSCRSKNGLSSSCSRVRIEILMCI